MGTEPQRQPWIGAIGLPAELARAIAADLPDYRVRRLPPLLHGAGGWAVQGSRPALVLVDDAVGNARAEREAVWRCWGPDPPVPVVEVSRATPIARVWLSPGRVEVVELGPGFLVPYLPPRPLSEGLNAQPSDRPTAPADRTRWWRRGTSFPVRLATYAAALWTVTALDRRLGVAVLCSVVAMLLAALLRRRARLPSRG